MDSQKKHNEKHPKQINTIGDAEPPDASIPSSDHPNKPENGQQPSKFQKFWVVIKPPVEIAALSAAVYVAIVSTCQWRAQIKQFADDERAWVVPFSVVSESSEMNAGSTIFKVLYKNTGKTPAVNVNAWIRHTGRLDSIPSKDVRPDTDAANQMLAPDGIGNTSTADTPTPDAVIREIKSGARYYIFGTIWYDDIYGHHHWSQFCYYPGPDLKAFGTPGVHDRCGDGY